MNPIIAGVIAVAVIIVVHLLVGIIS